MICAGVGQGATALHRYWIAKFFGPFLLTCIFLIFPNNWVDGFPFFLPFVAVVVAALFLLLQMMLLLDIGYSWNDIWIENALEDQRNDVEATGRSWFIALIVSGAIFVLLGL